MSDLTVIFLTENRLPTHWTEFQKKHLIEAIGNNDLITISRNKMDFGINIIQTEKRSISNIYRQILVGAKKATTRFIAIAEDDTLYVREHFDFRPKNERIFFYNMANWKIFNWGRPTYHSSLRIALNYVFIGSREIIIEVLEKRFKQRMHKHFGELGKYKIDRNNSKGSCSIDYFSTCEAIININHDKGFDDYCHRHVKRMGNLRAYDIPKWGKAKDLIKEFR